MQTGKDELIWKPSKKSYSAKIAKSFFVGPNSQVDWEFIWKIRVPHKIRLFLWEMQLNILPTKTFLAKRNTIYSEELCCPWCKVDSESLLHLLIRCKFAHAVWTQIFAW